MSRSDLWGIVLAGGQGRRLASLVRALCGQPVPKQFALLDQRQSLLQATVERISAVVPPNRTLVVVDRAYVDLARDQLRQHSRIEVVSQPRCAGTAPGLLLPLARIKARDPGAKVAVFPSDHFVPRPGPFLRAMENAIGALEHSPGRVVLLGVAPDCPETDYGWIHPIRPSNGCHAEAVPVRRFVEKPDPIVASRLLRLGALWNSFVSVGRVATYWRLASRLLPSQTALFQRYLEHLGSVREVPTLHQIYEQMEPADFSRAVLAHTRTLLVVPVGSGWSDWGTPARVLRSLDRSVDAGGAGTIPARRETARELKHEEIPLPVL